jgi:hypothetical protein
MGGNALKLKCVRLNFEIYNNIKTYCIDKLSKYCDFVSIKELPEKESFGDLDLLYQNNIDIKNIVEQLFSPKEIFINGEILSFAFEVEDNVYFQVDLIKVNDIEMAQLFFGYGDVGNIIGQMLKKNNLTFGEKGLWTIYEQERIMLSTDPKEITTFLELDYEKWKHGLTTKKEVYEWTMNCKYFDIDYFKPELFNHNSKRKYKRRAGYVEFIEYILEHPFTPKNKDTFDKDYITLFHKESEKNIIDENKRIIQLYQDKFNGHIFLQYIEAKLINKCKEEFKKSISNFNEYLYENTIEVINNDIKDFILKNKDIFIF